MNKIDQLVKFNGVRQDVVALIYGEKEYSYLAVGQEVDRMCSHLASDGVGGRVMVVMGNRPETIFSFLAISRAGCTFVPVHDQIKSAKLAQMIKDADVSTIITDDRHIDVVHEALASISTANPIVYNTDHLLAPRWKLPQSSTEIGAIVYTSGSTGEPKGVVCPHENMIAAVEIINEYLEHTPDDRILTTLPLSHSYGLYQALSVLAAGATLILEEHFLYSTEVLDKIEKLKVTGFPIVPAMATMIEMACPKWIEQLSGLRYITAAGAALPSQQFWNFHYKLPNTDIIPMWGGTEFVRGTYFDPKIVRQGERFGSCGVQIPRTVVTLEDGEAVVQGPTVMAGYWRKPEETAKVFRDGKYYTGDLFYKDDTGMCYYKGRKDHQIKIKGEKCVPIEVDTFLQSQDGITESASIAVEEEGYGHRIVTFVVSTLTEMQIRKMIRLNLDGHLMPRKVIQLKGLPKNDTGKVDYSLLQSSWNLS